MFSHSKLRFSWGCARQGRDRVMGSRTNELEALRLAREEKRQQEHGLVRFGCHLLVGGFKHFILSPIVGMMIQSDYFSEGFKPPTSLKRFGCHLHSGKHTKTMENHHV